jgi:murein DD-endopeptidase MepM/ murein hydrolase activator NlpD
MSGRPEESPEHLMRLRRYTISVTDRTTGVERRLSIAGVPVLAGLGALAVVPVLIGLGAAWKADADVAALHASHSRLEVENASYRAATEALTGQIHALQSAIGDLGAQAALDPALTEAMEKLPALVKTQAMGGTATSEGAARQDPSYAALSALANADDTFGLLRALLEGLESRLLVVRRDVERRNALAESTPSIWPVHGWISSTMGWRRDPMTGEADYHGGLDIAADRGQPVYATASGTVTLARYQGAYGNLVVVDHGFGLETRYGHLSAFDVSQGDHVQRGDIIGRVGATGRATGNHLHYEVLATGKLLNPLQLLTQQKPRDR